MGDIIVKVTPCIVMPLILFTVGTALCVLGNTVRGLLLKRPLSFGVMTLWDVYTCSSASVAPTCLLQDPEDHPFGRSSECDKFLAHTRATEAFGIISVVCAGVGAFVALFLIFQYKRWAESRIRTVGMITAGVVFVVSLVAFVLYITLKDRKCIKAQSDVDLHAAPFMFLGAAVLAALAAFFYWMYPRCCCCDDEETTCHEPQAGRGVGAAAGGSTVGTTTSGAPRVLLWPEGDDWAEVKDQNLLWSSKKQLYFDRSSGHFYDPQSTKWYNPDEKVWYMVTA